jgi:hypothetical protein
LCYQNANFALFRILIPYLPGYTDGGAADAQIQASTDAKYIGYMDGVFGDDSTITCTPRGSPTSWSTPTRPARRTASIGGTRTTFVAGVGSIRPSRTWRTSSRA